MTILSQLNSPAMYLICGGVIAVVALICVVFMVRAYRAGLAIGMDPTKMRRVIISSTTFTILPAVGILLGVIALSGSLGSPLPWLRLSVVGSLSYEAIAASNAVSAMGLELGKISNLTAQQFVNITLVMTISILVGIWLVPVIGKKLLGGMSQLEAKDKKWSEIFQNAMFIGMIAAFLGFVFCDVSMLWNPVEGVAPTTGLIPVCVMAASALVMVVLGLAMKKWKWLGDYALPISLVLGMISAIPITALLS